MGIRDEEINRLVHYAKGLGIKVSFKDYVPYSRDAGTMTTDNTELDIFVQSNEPKISIILTLIHELGHAMQNIYAHDRKPNEELDSALESEEDRKAERKIIYEYELKSSEWWENIYKETNMQFNINKLRLAREFDVWQYEVFYEEGKFPSGVRRKEKKKALRRKYAT